MTSDDVSVLSTYGFLLLVAGLSGFLFIYLMFRRRDSQSGKKDRIGSKGDGVEEDDHSEEEAQSKNGIATSSVTGKRTTKNRTYSQTGKQQFEHSWLSSTLKGHSRQILDLDFSSNGKYLITCSDDRSLFLWNTNDFDQKEHKTVKGAMAMDHAKCVRFGPDSKSILICLAFSNALTVYKLVKKEGAAAGTNVKFQPVENVEFPAAHKRDIINIGISSNGKYVMTASDDTTVIIWDLKGTILKTIDTCLGKNNYAAVSPCGRFVAASGFTPDVKVWEVTFSKTGDYIDVVRAFELKGHSSGIYSFDFSHDSTRMVTASKDGTFRIWDTNIRYQLGQEPYLIASGSLDDLKEHRALAAMSPNGDTVAITCRRSIRIYASDSGAEETRIDDAHGSEYISGLKFSVDGRYFVSVGDKIGRVFHNIAGYKAQAIRAKEQLKTAHGEALRERLKEQLRQADEICQGLTGKPAL